MDINFEKGTVTLFGKAGKLDTLIRKFTMLSGEQVYHFLVNRGIQFPRRMNCLALMSVLNRRIKFLNSNSLSKDYFTRLKYYSSFTEQQLFNLFCKICNDDNSFYAYRYNLFKLLLTNFVAMDFNDGELTYVKNLKKANIESFEQYFNYISGAGVEQEGTFDGQDLDVIRENLEFSASNQEVFDIASKYGIEIPQKLKKEDLLGFIVWWMQNDNSYNDQIGEELNQMTLQQLSTFAERTNIPMSANLSKKQAITYLFYILSMSEIETTSIKRIEVPEEYLPLEFTVDLTKVSVFKNSEPKKIIHYKGEENDNEEFNQVLIEEKEAEEEEEALEEAAQKEAEEKQKAEEEARLKAEEEARQQALAKEKEEAMAAIEEIGVDEYVEPVYEDGSQPQEEQPEEQGVTDVMATVQEDDVAEEIYEEQVEPQEQVVYYEDGSQADPDSEEINVAEEYAEEGPIILDEDLSDVEAASDEEIQALLGENEEQAEPVEEEKKADFDLNDVQKNDQYGSEKLQKLANHSVTKTIILSCFLGLAVFALVFILVLLLQ